MDNTNEAIRNASLQRAGPFNYGAGHVNPNVAGNPGLVYDLSVKHYYRILCSLNFNSTQIKAIAGKAFPCPAWRPKIQDLNYPSITVSQLKGSVIVERTVKNVAEGPVTYKAKVRSPPGVLVSVEPKELEFSKKGEEKSFRVALRAMKNSSGNYVFGFLTWKHARFLVASPIVVETVTV
jgi:hypothetical protein